MERITVSYIDTDTLDALITPPTNKVNMTIIMLLTY